MAKNAKNCPAAIDTEELVAYLHTLLQKNSHKEAHAQIALQIEQVFLAHGNITPMLANMERSRSELASQGKDKTVRLMKRAREESDEESGGGRWPSLRRRRRK